MRQAPPLLVVLIASLPAAATDLAANLGKQHAAAQGIEWEIRDAGHPILGNIRFAYVKRPVETRVGNQTVFSRAYLSCQREKRRFAVELANSIAPADPGGLKPATDPRLVCNRPTADGKVVREEILASWQVNDKIGDALASGLRAFPLRECAAISVQQEVVLPAGWPQKTARIEFDILPYNRELDAIFTTCGEVSAYAPTPATTAIATTTQSAPRTTSPPPKSTPSRQPPPAVAPPRLPSPPVAPPEQAAARAPSPEPPAPQVASMPAAPPPSAAPAPPPSPSPAPAPSPSPATESWREARVVPTGKTNVRAGPSTQSALIAELHPGSVVMVQRTGTDWWRARPNKGSKWDGYIRQDRLVFK